MGVSWIINDVSVKYVLLREEDVARIEYNTPVHTYSGRDRAITIFIMNRDGEAHIRHAGLEAFDALRERFFIIFRTS